MKQNPTRYSSAVGEVWVMATFKVKYCHKIFDMYAVRRLCDLLFEEACARYEVRCIKRTFDSDHVHMIFDMGLYDKPDVAKVLRGYVGFHLFRRMPWLKRWKFWASGLWNPAYDIRGVQDINVYMRYLDKQKYAPTKQTTLAGY